ncbi:hypothetical protein QQ008_21245 [Fulvivirgaceae bacterium BMA10]|uniref:Uncharacterized protein n=1 Tax=Splendidivirga corallicola TaxID=3051826 RepID=A0ABT8KT46_9BACT|nr:hypothetical protein [Fulvivirgaceae bacterium BMA10]
MTIALLSIIGTLLLVFIALMVAPLSIYINSDENKGLIKIGQLLQALILINGEGEPEIRFRFFFFTYHLSTNKPSKKKKKKKTSRVKPSKKKPFRIKRGLGMVRGVLRTFDLQFLRIDCDTGNYMLNAQLVPVCMMLSNSKRSLSTNFQGIISIQLLITNRLMWIALAVIRSLLKS